MIPASVTVSPSSGSEAGSNASSGGAAQYYFGGNPTAAAILGGGGGGPSWIQIAVVGVIGALIVALLLRK